MLLESLHDLVKTLIRRIDEHGAALRQSEALTRYALIDPLLRELGWDTEDPAMVMPEYRSSAGSADYALLSDGKPVMMVEAKKLGTPPQDAVSQVINYCLMEGVDYFAVTDGRQWEIYETHRRGNLDEKRITQINLTHSPEETCLKALALWCPAVRANNVSPGHPPIVDAIIPEVQPTPTPVDSSIPTSVVTPTPVYMPTPTPVYPPAPTPKLEPAPEAEGLVSLTEVIVEKGLKPPTEIVFPNQDRANIRYWSDLPVAVIRWLLSEGRIDASRCPVRGAGRRYIVNTTPTHPNGSEFSQPRYIEEGLYYEAHYSAPYHVRNAQAIIAHVGLDPAQFEVPFSRTPPVDPSIPTPVVTPTPVYPPAPMPNPEPVPQAERLLSLIEVKAERGSKPPTEIVFPNQDRANIRYWKDLPVAVIRWLLSESLINAQHCPIQGAGRRYIVHTTPLHPTGAEFTQPQYIEGLYYEANYSGSYHVRNTQAIITHVGVAPAEFKVTL